MSYKGGLDRILSKRFSLFILLFISFSAWGDQLLILPDAGREPVLELIRNSQQSIYLTMYAFTDDQLMQAVLDQRHRGKDVKIILERKPYRMEETNQKALMQFRRNRVALQTKIFPFKYIHQKSMLIDNKKAVVMTFNFTKSSFKNKIRNFGLVVENSKRVLAIKRLFLADWQRMPAEINDAIITGTTSREQLIHHLQSARKSIKIYAQSINDYKFIGALAALAKKGIKIDILTAKMPAEKPLNFLTNAGVHIHINQDYYIHAKTFLIDDSQAIVGSINLTRASFEHNRELAIVTTDKKVIKDLSEIFQRDLSETSRVTSSSAFNEAVLQIYHALKKYLYTSAKPIRTSTWLSNL